MTPKEKANHLVKQFYGYVLYENENVYSERMLRIFKIKAKNCALIAVDEIIDANPLKFDEDENPLTEYWWKQVKHEIENL